MTDLRTVDARDRYDFSGCDEATSLTAACRGITRDLSRAGYELPSVYLVLDGRLRCVDAMGYYQIVDGYPPGVGVIGNVVSTGVAKHITDVSAESGFIAARPNVVAEACVPVKLDGAVVGAVNVEGTSALPEDVVAHITAAARCLSAWIGGHGGMPDPPLAQRLARISVELTSLTAAVAIEQRAVRAAVELSGMSSAALLQREGRDWVVTAATGPLARSIEGWAGPDIEVVASSVAAGTSSHIARGATPPPAYAFLDRSGVASFTAQPLTVMGRVIAVLLTADSDGRVNDGDGPMAEREAVLELLAAQTAACLSTAASLAELSRQATSDALTGLANAAAFAQDLELAAQTCAQHAIPAQACLLLDIDRFKTVNDTYGHLAGDDLLRALATALADELRAPDRLYRIGGDEFAAIVRASDTAAAINVAQRLLSVARRIRTTVSIGVAMVSSTDPRVVRGQADAGLYLAKQAGRDTVSVGAVAE